MVLTYQRPKGPPQTHTHTKRERVSTNKGRKGAFFIHKTPEVLIKEKKHAVARSALINAVVPGLGHAAAAGFIISSLLEGLNRSIGVKGQ